VKYYIGIDNGSTGTIGIVDTNGQILLFCLTPTISSLNYQKKKTNITRVDNIKLYSMLQDFYDYCTESDEKVELVVYIERPMINPGRFTASLSAARALESTLVVLEWLADYLDRLSGLTLSTNYIDSKEWQKKLLGEDIKGSDNLKKASMELGMTMVDDEATKKLIKKHGDADGLLIAKYIQMMGL